MIVIRCQLDTNQFNTIRERIRSQFPAIIGQVQTINSAGQLRLVPVRGGTLPDGLTAEVVADMVATATTPDLRGGNLWNDTRWIRRNR